MLGVHSIIDHSGLKAGVESIILQMWIWICVMSADELIVENTRMLCKLQKKTTTNLRILLYYYTCCDIGSYCTVDFKFTLLYT